MIVRFVTRSLALLAATAILSFCAAKLCLDWQSWLLLFGALAAEGTVLIVLFSSFPHAMRDQVRELDDANDRVQIVSEVRSKGGTEPSPDKQHRDELLSALLNLGFTKTTGRKAVDIVMNEFPDEPIETQIKKALALLRRP